MNGKTSTPNGTGKTPSNNGFYGGSNCGGQILPIGPKLLWQVIMNSMYNMVKVQKLGHGSGCCTLCPDELEMNDHIFFWCCKAQHRWASTTSFYKPQPQNNSLVDANSMLDIMNNNLQKTRLTLCGSLWYTIHAGPYGFNGMTMCTITGNPIFCRNLLPTRPRNTFL